MICVNCSCANEIYFINNLFSSYDFSASVAELYLSSETNVRRLVGPGLNGSGFFRCEVHTVYMCELLDIIV